MPDIDLSYEATADDGRDLRAITESGQAGLAASVQERQQRAVTSQYPREQAQLQERLDRLSDALGDRVDSQQVETFRQGQMDQLRGRQDGVRQLYEAAQSAVDQLDQRQQPADEQPGHLQQLADEQPGQQRDVSRPYERQQAGLVDLVNRVLSQLSGVQDQQNACLRQQRQDALAAAASGAGGDLSRVLDRQRADRDALRDQLSRMRQDLDRSSRDPAALGGPASDAMRTARQGPSPQRSADTQRERGGQRAAGEAGQAGLAASLHERQQRHERVVAGQDRRERARLRDRLDQLGERVKGRVDPRQLDALRQGQVDQLRERHDASRQLRGVVRAAAAQLGQQRPRQQLTADGQQGRARDVGERRDQQQAALNLVSRVLSELSRVQDQQNAYLRRQRQDTLAAAASGAGGDLSRVLDRQRADRDAVRDQLTRIRQDLDRSSRDLAQADRQQPESRSAGHDTARQRKEPVAHQARHDAVPRQSNGPSRGQREAQRYVVDEQATEIIRPEKASPMNGITAQTHAAVERSFTEASQADAQDVYRTTANLAKGNFGERMAAAALARDGHQVMYFKPSILGTNQGGIDIYSYKDGLVYLIDNKAFTSHGNISSVSALTTNLAKNIATAERDLAAMAADVTRSVAERQIIRQALTALQQNQYVKAVTNAALTKNAEIKTGVTQALASRGIRFIDVFKNRGGGLSEHL
jgi:hypothetical protein